MEQFKCSSDPNEFKQINRLYNTKEASKLLGVSVQSIRRAIKKEQIKPVYLNNILRISNQEIQKFFEKEDFIDVKNASNRLSVSEDTVRGLIKNGHIKAARISEFGPYRIPKEEIEKFTGK